MSVSKSTMSVATSYSTMTDTFYCNTCEREVDVEYIDVHNGHSKQ